MKTKIYSLLALALAPWAAWAKLNVVATLPDLASIAQVIGGSQVEILSLARPTEDPHFVEPKPSLILKLNRANVLLEGGAELESGWLEPLLQSARNAALASGGAGRVRCNGGVQMLEVPEALDRSKGDLHAAGNPHYLMDPANARMVATNITEAFCRLDASHSDQFRANLQSFTQRVESKLAEWEKKLAPFKGRRVVAYHNSWPYLSKRFGLKVDLYLEPKPGIPPTPSHLAQVIETMKAEHINVIMEDPYQSRRTADTVASKTGAKVVPVTQFPGGVKGTEQGYVEMMEYVVDALARALVEP